MCPSHSVMWKLWTQSFGYLRCLHSLIVNGECYSRGELMRSLSLTHCCRKCHVDHRSRHLLTHTQRLPCDCLRAKSLPPGLVLAFWHIQRLFRCAARERHFSLGKCRALIVLLLATICSVCATKTDTRATREIDKFNCAIIGDVRACERHRDGERSIHGRLVSLGVTLCRSIGHQYHCVHIRLVHSPISQIRSLLGAQWFVPKTVGKLTEIDLSNLMPICMIRKQWERGRKRCCTKPTATQAFFVASNRGDLPHCLDEYLSTIVYWHFCLPPLGSRCLCVL